MDITPIHAKFIHDFACSMFLNLTRGEAHDLIKKIFKKDIDMRPFEVHTTDYYDADTLRDNK